MPANTNCDEKCKTQCFKELEDSAQCTMSCNNDCKKGGTSSGTRISYETGKV